MGPQEVGARGCVPAVAALPEAPDALAGEGRQVIVSGGGADPADRDGLHGEGQGRQGGQAQEGGK